MFGVLYVGRRLGTVNSFPSGSRTRETPSTDGPFLLHDYAHRIDHGEPGMNTPRSSSDEGHADDHLQRGGEHFSDSAADDEQNAAHSNQRDAAYELEIRTFLWKAVGRHFTAERIAAFCTVGILVITSFYTYYARQQAGAAITAGDAARDAVALARKNSEFDQRAWLSVSLGLNKIGANQQFETTLHTIITG